MCNCHYGYYKHWDRDVAIDNILNDIPVSYKLYICATFHVRHANNAIELKLFGIIILADR